MPTTPTARAVMGPNALRQHLAQRIKGISKKQDNISLMDFTQRTFPGYDMNWHHKLTCKVLERWVRGNIPRLLISQPPRHGKSELCSIRLPAWLLGHNPDAQIISTSYSARLATRNTRHVRRVMKSGSYARIFPGVRLPRLREGYANNNSEFEIPGYHGHYLSAGIGGPITGEGMNYGIVDDPFKNRKEANSKVFQETVWDWFKSTFRTRLHKNGSILVTATRWHDGDLIGRILDADSSNHRPWYVLNIPAIAEESVTVGYDDPRKEGEALWPSHFPIEELNDLKATLGTFEFPALYQGNPHDDEASIFKAGYWQYYDEIPKRPNGELDFIAIEQTWDTAFKEGEENDYSVCLTWGITENAYYLLHMLREKMDYPTLKAASMLMYDAWHPNLVVVEDKGSGTSIIQDLRNDTQMPIIGFQPEGDKIYRAKASTGPLAAGKVYLPNPASNSWVQGYVDRLRRFPNDKHDDDVDATTMFLLRHIAGSGFSGSFDASKFRRGR